MSEPEHFTQPRWRCPHCRKSWSSKSRARQHVAGCWHDPAAKTCRTCIHNVRLDSERDPERVNLVPTCVIEVGNPTDIPPPHDCERWEARQ